MNNLTDKVFDFYLIASNYNELLNLDAPILFTGKNKFGSKVLGSIGAEDDDAGHYIFYQTPLEDKDYYDFVNKKISLRSIYEKQKDILQVIKKYNKETISQQIIEFSNIPIEHAPLEHSYCPDFLIPKSTEFSFSLKGKLAEFHKAIVNDVNEMQEKLFDVFNQSTELLKGLHFATNIFLQPSEKSSFKINFDIEFEASDQLNIYDLPKNELVEFYNGFMDYVMRGLPEGNENLLGSTSEAKSFQDVRNKLQKIYDHVHIRYDNLDERLIDEIAQTALKVSQITNYMKDNKTFDAIELNKTSATNEFSYGYLTVNYLDQIKDKILLPDESSTIFINESKEIDVEEKPYRILVTRLNVENGNGGAWLFVGDSENFNRISLYVEKGDKELLHSSYTKSLDEGKVIDVKGKATKVDGAFRKLHCKL